MTILVTGASGKAGREVVRALGERGATVRSGTRADDPPLDLAGPATWDTALDGVCGVFLLRPPALSDMAATLVPFVERVRAHGAGPVVFLSVAGAERSRLVPHRAVELVLEGRRDATILRPGFFAQNLEDAYIRDIREDDRLYVPAGRGRVAFLDLRDLGEIAADALLDPSRHGGQAYALTGPRAVRFCDVANMLSEATGRQIGYVPASALGYALHLRRRGLAWGQLAIQTWLHLGLRRGDAETVDPTLTELLGRPARDMSEYVRDHAGIWTAE